MSDSINNPLLRELLLKALKTDSDFNAFCLDYFPKTYNRFSLGMDRIAKTNLLFELNDPSNLFEKLAVHVPELSAIVSRSTNENSHQEVTSLKSSSKRTRLSFLFLVPTAISLVMNIALLTYIFHNKISGSQISKTKQDNVTGPLDTMQPQLSFSHVLATDQDDYFALDNKRQLVWLGSFTPKTDPETLPICPIKISNDWNYQFLFSAGQGILYGVTKEGELYWHKYSQAHYNAPPVISGKTHISGGLAGYKHVFGGIGGTIYASTENNTLLKYRHTEWREGKGFLAKTDELGSVDLPFKEARYRAMFSTDSGIYAVDQDNDMWFFIISPDQPLPNKLTHYNAGNGWGTKFVFPGPARMVIGADVYRKGICGASFNIYNNEHHQWGEARPLRSWRTSWCSPECE